NQTKLHQWMCQHEIPLTAYCPLGQGRFMTDKKLIDIASVYLRTPAQIILRWMMQQQDVLAIPKTTNYHRLVENFEIFDFELSSTEMEMINAWRLEHQRVVAEQSGAKFD
ncbi:MAG: aldo/keto reductase, partial [Bacteroidota bacterium]|nr:aldo/keto reductase [Bacteroidota bacterium]